MRREPKITLAELDRLLARLMAADKKRLAAISRRGHLRYQDVAARLRMRMVSEGWRPGSAMPPVSWLAAAYGVSGKTMWRAVDLLCDEGLVERRGTRCHTRLYVAAEAPALPAPTGTGPSPR